MNDSAPIFNILKLVREPQYKEMSSCDRHDMSTSKQAERDILLRIEAKMNDMGRA